MKNKTTWTVSSLIFEKANKKIGGKGRIPWFKERVHACDKISSDTDINVPIEANL